MLRHHVVCLSGSVDCGACRLQEEGQGDELNKGSGDARIVIACLALHTSLLRGLPQCGCMTMGQVTVSSLVNVPPSAGICKVVVSAFPSSGFYTPTPELRRVRHGCKHPQALEHLLWAACTCNM